MSRAKAGAVRAPHAAREHYRTLATQPRVALAGCSDRSRPLNDCGGGTALKHHGYRRIHVILRREGWLCNRKRAAAVAGRGPTTARQTAQASTWQADARARRSGLP